MLKILKQIFCIFMILAFVACAKKEQVAPQNTQERELKDNKTSIPFAKNKKESNEWYKKYFGDIIKDSKNGGKASDFEGFAKLYFADLSQMDYENLNDKDLAQSVVFTHFAQELLSEYLFIKSQNVEIAPWSDFSSKISFASSIESANFVLKIANLIESNSQDSIETLYNRSFTNFNNVVLANSLQYITNHYANSDSLLAKSSEITGLNSYKMPRELENFLYYRILYFKYNEKYESGYLLDRFAFQHGDSMLDAINSIFERKSGDVRELKEQFRFQNFEKSNTLAILQCKGAMSEYPFVQDCVRDVFIPWIIYLEKQLKNTQYFLPLFVDSKLCLLVGNRRQIRYAENKSQLCESVFNQNQIRIESK